MDPVNGCFAFFAAACMVCGAPRISRSEDEPVARLFSAAGVPLSGVLVRNVDAAAAKGIHKRFPANLEDDLQKLTANSDLILIAVTDAHIGEVASNLKGFHGIVCHTSGSFPLSSIAEKCANAGVLYPLQTLTTGSELSPAEIPLCIEASDETVRSKLELLAVTAGFNHYYYTSEQRLMLHVAAVISCNFTNHLLALAGELINDTGLGSEILKPLVRETFRKASINDPALVQTGPAKRGDIVTIDKHLAVLAQYPKIRYLYKILSDSIADSEKSK